MGKVKGHGNHSAAGVVVHRMWLAARRRGFTNKYRPLQHMDKSLAMGRGAEVLLLRREASLLLKERIRIIRKEHQMLQSKGSHGGHSFPTSPV